MNIKAFFRALAIKASRKCRSVKITAKSYVSLFLIAVLIVGGTAAWFATSSNSAQITSQTLKMTGASGITDDQMKVKQTKVIIPNFRLEEASSVDGRNIFFPSTFTKNASEVNDSGANSIDSIKTQTENLVFREGNAGDKNVRYAYADTDIMSSGGEDTNVWLKGYKVTIGSNVYQDKFDLYYDNSSRTSGTKPTGQYFPNTCPVRIAIIDDSGHTPKVFDPSARIRDEKFITNTHAIYSITTEGKPTTYKTNLDSFSSYYYGTDNPLFVVPAGHMINLTVVAWLEGTHPYAKDYIGQEMNVEIEIETNVSEMEMIYLHDWTVGDNDGSVNSSNWRSKQMHWVYNPSDGATETMPMAMQYFDSTANTYKTTVMKKIGNYTYQAAIPKYINTKISFYRINNQYNETDLIATNPDSSQIQQCPYGSVFNSWHTYTGVNDALEETIQNNSNWKVLGDLAEDRLSPSGETYTHYYMIRGNDYGWVDHNLVDRYQRWLAPCIGYWGTSSGPVSRSS